MNRLYTRYVGDRNFYRTVLVLIVPMIIQQGITSFVGLLDNLMVGSLGTDQMSGVSIVNQLLMNYNLTIFGSVSAAGIFSAQFFGKNDRQGMVSTMRIKLYFGIAVTLLSFVIFFGFGKSLILLFLDHEVNSRTDTVITLDCAMAYLHIILWSLPPFMVVQSYSSSLRESGQTFIPMVASVSAIGINLFFNYCLIFGKLGFPAMGASGAALATVICRYVEMAVVVIYTHLRTEKMLFAKGLYRSLRVPISIIRQVIITGWPLLLNEILWSIGTTIVNQNYSIRGLTVIAAINIEATAWQLFSIIMFGMGNAASIMIGQLLGAGKVNEAKDTSRKLLALSIVSQIAVGIMIIATAGLIPKLYNTEPEVRSLAASFLRIVGLSLPIHAFIHCTYFIIRSGGRTFVTMLFDSGYTWCVPVVLSSLLCRLTSLGIVTVFFIIQFSDLIKVFIGVPMLRSGFWARNLVNRFDEETLPETE